MRFLEDLSQKLRDARSAGREADVALSELPDNLADAYRFALSTVEDMAGAWKLGGVNPWSQRMFANTELFFGPLAANEVFHNTKEMPVSNLNQPLAEVEIALKIGNWPPNDATPLFTEMAIAVEIPATVLPQPAKGTLLGQVSDRAGAGALWLGEPQAFDATLLMSPIAIELCHDGGVTQEGSSSNILATPLGAAFEFLALTLKYGVPLRQGQWIATGGLCPASPVAANSTLTISHPFGHSSLVFV